MVPFTLRVKRPRAPREAPEGSTSAKQVLGADDLGVDPRRPDAEHRLVSHRGQTVPDAAGHVGARLPQAQREGAGSITRWRRRRSWMPAMASPTSTMPRP